VKLERHVEEPIREEDPGQSETGTEEDGLGRLAEERGITPQILRAAGIRTDIGGRHDGWWRIPYPHRTGIHKCRYRNPDPGSQPKYLDDTGAKFHLYNPGLLGPGEDEIWFAEGEFDTLALMDQGFKAIGIHGVANASLDSDDEEPEGRFRRSWQLLFEDTLCLTIFDNDEAGRQGGRRLARGLGGEAFDGWVDDFEDVNDWHRRDSDGLGAALHSFRARVRRGHGLA